MKIEGIDIELQEFHMIIGYYDFLFFFYKFQGVIRDCICISKSKFILQGKGKIPNTKISAILRMMENLSPLQPK